jgi:hypothetical protein
MRGGSALSRSHERRIAVPNTRGQFTRNGPTKTPFVGPNSYIPMTGCGQITEASAHLAFPPPS